MITDLEAALKCQAVYGGPAGFDYWIEAGGIVAGLTLRGQDTEITFRGSQTLDDWLRDVDALPYIVDQLGAVHAGFWRDCPLFVNTVTPLLQGRIILDGHSLGAARACVVAGLLTITHRYPAQLVLFGCPRPGGEQLRRVIQQSGALVRSFRNRSDPVCDLPPPLLYRDIMRPIELYSPDDPALSIEDHFMASGYVAALSQGVPQP